MSTNATLKKVMRELATLEEPKMRQANERRGDDHGVNLTHLRALAKRLKTQHELACARWVRAHWPSWSDWPTSSVSALMRTAK